MQKKLISLPNTPLGVPAEFIQEFWLFGIPHHILPSPRAQDLSAQYIQMQKVRTDWFFQRKQLTLAHLDRRQPGIQLSLKSPALVDPADFNRVFYVSPHSDDVMWSDRLLRKLAQQNGLQNSISALMSSDFLGISACYVVSSNTRIVLT